MLGVAQRALACERVVGGVAAGQGALLGLDGDTFLPAYQEVLVVLQLAEQVREALNLSTANNLYIGLRDSGETSLWSTSSSFRTDQMHIKYLSALTKFLTEES